jgi:hypothetical protein
MSKIYQDKHGLYIKANGGYYRPILAIGYKHLEKESKLLQGDNIKTMKIGGSPLLSIENGETWFIHGYYFEGVNSEEAFKPNIENW